MVVISTWKGFGIVISDDGNGQAEQDMEIEEIVALRPPRLRQSHIVLQTQARARVQ